MVFLHIICVAIMVNPTKIKIKLLFQKLTDKIISRRKILVSAE